MVDGGSQYKNTKLAMVDDDGGWLVTSPTNQPVSTKGSNSEGIEKETQLFSESAQAMARPAGLVPNSGRDWAPYSLPNPSVVR